MTYWGDGYVTEISYTHGFYRELSPAHMKLALLCARLASPPAQQYTWAELGCGQGLTANLLAAANPEGQFFATDFNPSHIGAAQALQAKAGLTNITFQENSFQEYIDANLPPLDYICLHGIYSWISPENKAHIVEFIRRHLKPCGVVYISYNCLPGWAAAYPLRQLLYERGQHTSGPILERVERALSYAEQLCATNSGYFKANPAMVQRLEGLKKQNRHYLAHEYFNGHWEPLYVTQVAADLEPAKLSFAVSANLLEQVDALNVPQAAKDIYAETTDPLQRQLLRDYLTNQQFRRDLFSRGTVPLTPFEQAEQLQHQGFALTQAAQSIPLQFNSALGEVTLQTDIYQPLIERLTQGPATIAQLGQHPAFQTLTLDRLLEALIVMVGAGWAAPALATEEIDQRREATQRFNQAVVQSSRYSTELQYLASPVTGSGIQVDRIEQLFLLGMAQQQSPADFAWQVLVSQNQALVKDGQPLQTPAENQRELKEKADQFAAQKLPVLKHLQIVD